MGRIPATRQGVSQLPSRPAASFPQPAEPLIEELGSGPDPEAAFLRVMALPRTIFFDSGLTHPRLGRYSFLTADPFEWISARGRPSKVAGQPESSPACDPLMTVAGRLARYRLKAIPGLPPFQGGAAGLFGYELCHHLERLPRVLVDEFAVPDLAVGLYDWVLSWDHEQNRAWLIATGLPETDPGRRRKRARERLQQLHKLLCTPVAGREGACRPEDERFSGPRSECDAVRPVRAFAVPGHDLLKSNFDRQTYLAAVRRAIDYVHAGDCFQVNLAQRLLCPVREPAAMLYLRLRQRNPAPFAAYFDLGDFQIASASPERFALVKEGEVLTRPIKGTRPRSPTPTEDWASAQALLASAKDRAENIMIVDLLRNDLGRVCRYGSVQVPSLCNLESFRYVHHLVSEVRGRLRPGLGPIDLLRAAFPGGSVTGAPKIRAMEIIAELEETARGPYCGCLAYIGFDGNMDSSILIRTFTQGRGWVQFPVGGGIVADSSPEREYEETWHKAEGLVRSLR
jgi:para-aminobenzoate synthetase component I